MTATQGKVGGWAGFYGGLRSPARRHICLTATTARPLMLAVLIHCDYDVSDVRGAQPVKPRETNAMATQFRCAAAHEWQSADDGNASLTCPVCGAPPTLESLGAPPQTAAALARLRDDLQRAAGKNLAGIILYGGLARGRYHPGKSDINLVVL